MVNFSWNNPYFINLYENHNSLINNQHLNIRKVGKIILIQVGFFCFTLFCNAQKNVPSKPRIIVSTDIGGTDPDDNQSMIHLLMYSDKVLIEGLISSPSYGDGSKKEILRMIDLYEKDYPVLQQHSRHLLTPQYLRSVTKQGQKGGSPFRGYSSSTEGSDWIIRCANKVSENPLWVLVWGGLDDVAQALHDAPEIQNKIKVYWIGGPNKKWSANSYAYIVSNFPDLWFIEVNSSYYGFFSDNQNPDMVKHSNYYVNNIQGAGNLGSDFKKYYGGSIKMGDTPSLLYMMDGDPNDPSRDSWGGSFEKIRKSPRVIYNKPTSILDTVAFCTILEFRFKGPKLEIPKYIKCFEMEIPYGNSSQIWPGYYNGNGEYVIRYIPKKAEVLNYKFNSEIKEIDSLQGSIVIDNSWPGKESNSDYQLGNNWYTDKSGEEFYDGVLQGAKTIKKWKSEVLSDWSKRWGWLKFN